MKANLKGKPVQEYHFLRKHGIWTLVDVATRREHSYGASTQLQALRRAAAFLKNRRGISKLRIHTIKGLPVSERVYQGAEPVAGAREGREFPPS